LRDRMTAIALKTASPREFFEFFKEEKI